MQDSNLQVEYSTDRLAICSNTFMGTWQNQNRADRTRTYKRNQKSVVFPIKLLLYIFLYIIHDIRYCVVLLNGPYRTRTYSRPVMSRVLLPIELMVLEFKEGSLVSDLWTAQQSTPSLNTNVLYHSFIIWYF